MAKRRFEWWMIPLLWLAFALGVRMLQADILWFDEAKTVYFNEARHAETVTLVDVWNNLAVHDPWQSPGYYLLLGAWTKIVGWSDFAARSLSLFLGIIGLAWLYRLGRDFLNAHIGLYSVVVLVGSSLTIHYFHEMRPYSLYILTTCLSVWAYWRIITSKRQPSFMLYFALFIGLAGLAYTHVFALLTAFGIGAYHLLFVSKNRGWLMVTSIMLLSAIAFLPWFGHILRVIRMAQDDTERQAVALFGTQILSNLIHAFSNGHGALVLLLAAYGVYDKRRAVRFVVVWLIVAVLLAVLISYRVPAFIHIRYLFGIWTALALLMAVGIDRVASKGIPVTPILLLWLIIGGMTSWDTRFFESLPNSRINIPREGFMQMVDILQQHSREQDSLVLHTSPPFEEWDTDDTHFVYFPRVAAHYTHMELIRPIAFEANEAAYMAAVDEVLEDSPVVWTALVPDIPYTRRRDSFFQQLNSTHTFCQQVIDRPDMNVQLYARSTENVVASFGDGAVQIEVLWDVPQTSDSTIDVFLGINRSPDLPPDTYSVSIQLYDANGGFVRNLDYGIPNEMFSCRWSTLDNVPSGAYQLALIVYTWQTGERLAADNGNAGEPIFIGEVIVE